MQNNFRSHLLEIGNQCLQKTGLKIGEIHCRLEKRYQTQ